MYGPVEWTLHGPVLASQTTAQQIPVAPMSFQPQMTKEQEIQYLEQELKALEEEKKALEQDLESIRKRINELKSQE
jgi:predicted  nucleic acid-binding Zn-ribbon protein